MQASTGNRLEAVASRLKKGDLWVWLGGACVSLIVILFLTLVGVVVYNGFRTFWAADVAQLSFKDGTHLLGTITRIDEEAGKHQLYIGNRDLYGLDFRWVEDGSLSETRYPKDIVVLERVEKGNFIGFLEGLDLGSGPLELEGPQLWSRFKRERDQMAQDLDEPEALLDQIKVINRRVEKLDLRILRARAAQSDRLPGLEAQKNALRESFQGYSNKLDKARAKLRLRVALLKDGGGKPMRVALVDIVRAYRPNQMGAFAKTGLYLGKIRELLLDAPRESNTEGGLFPAIVGTVLMVFLMSLFCVPLGVVTAVYLREYAGEGLLVNLVRIAVNNLAGVPSIVYGMFGLGFFVYGIGGSIDNLFFSESLPQPTFGTGGMLWASLTMALLTVPVVIVSTEEGLNSVPQGVRHGSLALGATKFQTLCRVVLPMASPGMLTGLILAIARAAGEVAPLMLVGVVKLVPSLPIDGQFPFIQLERKFMHLGFHIYDVGFQSPNVEAAKPMVYVTTLLLLLIVLGMSFLAMYLRNRMKKRFTLGAF